jgi:hypothetical protein
MAFWMNPLLLTYPPNNRYFLKTTTTQPFEYSRQPNSRPIMFPPPSDYAQSGLSNQSTVPPNPSHASRNPYEQRGLPEPAYPPYAQTETGSRFGLGQMAKPQIGKSYCGGALSTNPPPYPQSRANIPDDQASYGCPPATVLNETSQKGCPAPSFAFMPPSRRHSVERDTQRHHAPTPQATSLSVPGYVKKEALERDEVLFSALPGDDTRDIVKKLYQGSLR